MRESCRKLSFIPAVLSANREAEEEPGLQEALPPGRCFTHAPPRETGKLCLARFTDEVTEASEIQDSLDLTVGMPDSRHLRR